MNRKSRQQLLAHVRRTAVAHNPMFPAHSKGHPRQGRKEVLAARLSWVARATALLDTPYGTRSQLD